MSLPTLLLKGNLEATEYSPKQKDLDEYIPLDYIMKWFDDRVPPKYGENPKIKATSPADKILIAKSSTGSGKSTLLPPKLYHLFQERTKKNIFCTQPRALTAIEIPKNTIPPFNTKEALIKAGFPNYEPLVYGKNIGTQTGVFSKRPIRGLVFGTPGIVTAQMSVMSNEEFMRKYSFIIIDEAHERSVPTDTLLYMLKKFVSNNYKNKDCPFVVVMSATFDTTKFCDYLLSDVPAPERYKNIIKVKGFTYPIEKIYLQYDSLNFVQSIIDTIVKIHKENTMDFIDPKEIMKNKKIYKLEEDLKEDAIVKAQKFRDILVFVKGPGEILKIKNKINKLNVSDEYFKKYPVLPLGLTGELVANQSIEYRNTVEKNISELTVELMSKKKETKKPTRRVIISTNVAETGITIETLKYVVEPGWAYSKEFNPCFAVDLLVAKPVTQSMHNQRSGRVGRKAPGKCYPIFTEKIFNSLQEDQYPDIIKSDVTLDLLSILIREIDPENEINEHNIYDLFNRKKQDKYTDFELKINSKKINIYELDLLDLPSADNLHYAMEKLYTLGAINSNSIPTISGFIINKFRFIRIESIRMIISGYAWNTSIQDLVTIAAFLESEKDDIFPKDKKSMYDKALSKGKFTLFSGKKIISYSELKTELMISDEFIRYILIFNEFKNKLSEINIRNLDTIKKTGDRKKKYDLSSKNIIENLQDWGDEYGISIKGLLEVIKIRDSLVDNMALIGLNPYNNHEKSYYNVINAYSDKDKIEYIANLKQCIFEGYKLNIAIWNNIEKKYYTRKTHLPLIIESNHIMSKYDILKYGDSNPKYIIYDKITYFLNTKTNLYEPMTSHISIMDGYVTIDPNFDSIL